MDSPARPSLQPKMASSTGGTEGSSPASSPASAASLAAMAAAPKFGTLVPNRIFVGGISASTSEAELAQLFSAYGNVKATKIIADRGGVSKGYGFVTFETEEEAKRLQQESECIILRERKLNIAPAIKKQPFNRSFDGGTGSPPTVPTSTYYYTNGMGLPYQNSMSFYNAGAPAPGAALAPPTDPAALYQTTGVFGPQATPSHQPYAPVMYPVPAPSLYMPQQYQYSPMPYEAYYPGAVSSSAAPPYLYGSGPHQGSPASIGPGGGVGGGVSSASNGAGGNGSGSGSAATETTSPAGGPVGGGSSAGPGPFGTHFYGPVTHHPLSGGPQQPPAHLDHLYYSYSAQSQPPPPPSGSIGSSSTQSGHQQQQQLGISLAEQQLQLVYASDMIGQTSGGNDLQPNQSEDTQSMSCHLEQLQQTNAGETSGGAVSQSSESSGAAAGPLLKYPVSNRYPNLHTLPSHSQQHRTSTTDLNPKQHSLAGDDASQSAVHYRSMSVYSGPVYMYHPPGPNSNPNAGTSLLPTPPQQPFDLGSTGHPKYRDYNSKPFTKSAPPMPGQPHHNPSAYARHYSGQALSQQQPAHHQAKFGSGTRPGIYPQQQQPQLQHYGRRGPSSSGIQQQQQQMSGSPAYFFSHKQSGPRSAQQQQQQQTFSSAYAPSTRNYPSNEQYSSGASGRRSAGSDHPLQGSQSQSLTYEARQSGRGRQFGAGGPRSASVVPGSSSSNSGADTPKPTFEACSGSKTETASTKNASDNSSTGGTTQVDTSVTISPDNTNDEIADKGSDDDCELLPSAKSSTPSARLSPNLSPCPNQHTEVQPSESSDAQQRRIAPARYSPTSHQSKVSKNVECPMQSCDGEDSRNKVNGVGQKSSGKPSEEDVDGQEENTCGGDVPPTPPATPLQSSATSDTQSHQVNDSCHQLQALSL